MLLEMNKAIFRYKDQISSKEPLSQAIECQYQPWKDYFKDNKEVASRIGDIESLFKQKIARRGIITYMQQPERDLMTAFLMVMLWGYGADEGGKSDARGRWRVAQMTKDCGKLRETLCKARDWICQNKIEKAYNEFRIPWCGPNFFTKYFYFIGKSLDQQKYPLIYDDRVATGLVKLNLCSDKPLEFVTIQTKRKADAYVKYVDMIHGWSVYLGCKADQVELFLFEYGAGRQGTAVMQNRTVGAP